MKKLKDAIARVAPKDAVAARLTRSLGSRAERERGQAAAAAVGLVDRDAAITVQLLDPLLEVLDCRIVLIELVFSRSNWCSRVGW